ncbi:MAG: hypothetical protein H6679_02175 [Epsilonproteobacteria bacterium]|nr:hypothetical protein [Campylobacterota bacterium]
MIKRIRSILLMMVLMGQGVFAADQFSDMRVCVGFFDPSAGVIERINLSPEQLKEFFTPEQLRDFYQYCVSGFNAGKDSYIRKQLQCMCVRVFGVAEQAVERMRFCEQTSSACQGTSYLYTVLDQRGNKSLSVGLDAADIQRDSQDCLYPMLIVGVIVGGVTMYLCWRLMGWHSKKYLAEKDTRV